MVGYGTDLRRRCGSEKEYIRKSAAGILETDGKPYEHRVRHKDGSFID